MTFVFLSNSVFKLDTSLLMKDNESVLACCSHLFCFEMTVMRSLRFSGADPARVHWVHVHPPCV